MGLFNWLSGNTVGDENAGISASELLQQVRSGQAPYIVDVRERDELEGPLGALPGVRNVPLSEFVRRISEIPKDRRVVLICRSGHRSGRAFAILKSHGYTQIQNAQGGMMAVRGAEKRSLK